MIPDLRHRSGDRVKIPSGANDRHNNNNRRGHSEASGSNTNTNVSVCLEEWAVTHNVVVSNTSIPLGVSQGTLSSYHAILEKNRVRLAKEQ
jgi:hypothetical protein